LFFYYSGAQLAAVRYKNWKFIYYRSQTGAEGWFLPLIPYHFTLMTNLKRDPRGDRTVRSGVVLSLAQTGN
jgi:hypothetical protein